MKRERREDGRRNEAKEESWKDANEERRRGGTRGAGKGRKNRTFKQGLRNKNDIIKNISFCLVQSSGVLNSKSASKFM